MSRRIACMLVAAAAAASAAASAADLTVVFVNPENFTDAAYSHPNGTPEERAVVMRDVERHLAKLAERGLPAGAALRIEVLDIDLAGWFGPFTFRTGIDLRVLRDITWPRIKLRYTLSRGDRVLASGEQNLSGLNYLMTVNRYSGSDRLRYEKAMLDDWFARRIVTAAGAPA